MDKNILMELLAKKEFKAVRSILDVMNAVDIASLLSDLEGRELVQAFRLISKNKAADVFANMSNSMQSYLITIFTEKELKEILDDMFMDDTVDLLEDLPANVVTRILENIDPQKRKEINVFLNYPEDSAGTIMTTEYVDLNTHMTVSEAMTHIKRVGIHKETIYTCYVLEARKLVGIVTAKDLMTADDNTKIADLMETEIISVNTHDDKEEVGKLFSKYDLLALPVLDADNRMVGIVTVDDAMDVVVDEATEDITIMAAMSPSEDTYFETSVFQHAKNRIPWLLILMLTATVTGVIINKYEEAFAAIPSLVAFIPMLMDTGGNCGSQSSTLIIRGIALGEIEFRDIFRVMFKELRVSLICGIVLAIANGIRVLLMYQNSSLALVIAVSLLVTVMMAKIIGCTLPLLAKKINLDPALMASPLITTLVDTGSILIYFNIATLIFHLSLN
jgi:magnesium transporter